MKKLFGTDGIRGEAGQFPLDAATAEAVGVSLSIRLQEKLGHAPLLVIGRDTRESGDWLERSLVVGASRAGARVEAAGIITTPGVAFLARTLQADAGVVISASHNPYRDNGIKIFVPSGRKLDDETERLVESDIFAAERNGDSPADSHSPEISKSDDGAALRQRYLDFLVNEIGHGLSLSGVKLVLDCANGAASTIAPQLFTQLGASVTAIGNNPDGRNINLDCGSLHTQSLQSEVLRQSADLGVAFDGDADRALFVDAKGQLINGDGTLWVLANYMRKRGKLYQDTVVATVMSNIGLEVALGTEGINLVRTDVGDKYVLEELLRRGATLGGEQSGHIIFPELSLAGDGLITTICLLRALNEEGKALHELTKGFHTFPQILVNVVVKTKRPFAELGSVQNAVRDIEAELGTKGRLLLRYSGTEPLARVMIEGENQKAIERQANELAALIQNELGT